MKCEPIPKEALDAYFSDTVPPFAWKFVKPRKSSVDIASNSDEIQTGSISCVYSVATV